MRAEPQPSLSIVVPCYRSPGTLDRLAESVLAVVDSLASEVELIFVDDGSPDDTWGTIQAIVARDPRVRGVRLMRNYGQHNALLAGLRAAKLDLVLTMDDDLQNPSDQIPLLFDALTSDTDLVYGAPIVEQQTGFRNLASRAVKRSMRLALGDAVNPKHSAFRLFRRTLVDAATRVHDPFVSIDVLLSWGTVRQAVVPVRFDIRSSGTSGYTLRRLIRHAMNMVTGYSLVPLRLVTLLGFAASAAGFGLALFVLARYAFFGGVVHGFTFLASAVSIFAGVQLLGLGIIGEYLGRVHFRSMGRPNYVVRERAGQDG